ncbi:MAG: hypothetical protein JWN14_420 [Chthonomonadales bacterium]|nr:hypothetical protein [Chthonomonadales bacterium]
MHQLFESQGTTSEMSHSPLIEDYLDRLCAPLVDTMTYEQRLATREEIRAHLLVLAAGHEELGSSPDEAIQAALQQFGEAKQIGRSLLNEYRSPFAFMVPLLWYQLHAAVGVMIGTAVLIAADCMLQWIRMPHFPIAINCVMGLVSGWIPGVWLLRRPTSCLRASLRTGGYYLMASTGLMLFFGIVSGFHLARDLGFYLTYIFATSGAGVVGGAIMSSVFRRLERFSPLSAKPVIAR